MRLIDNRILVFMTPQERDALWPLLKARGYTRKVRAVTVGKKGKLVDYAPANQAQLLWELFSPQGVCVGEMTRTVHPALAEHKRRGNPIFALEPAVLEDCLEAPGAAETFGHWRLGVKIEKGLEKVHYLWQT